MTENKYYYKITMADGEDCYMELDLKPKDPAALLEFLQIDGVAEEITQAEYDACTEEEREFEFKITAEREVQAQ